MCCVCNILNMVCYVQYGKAEQLEAPSSYTESKTVGRSQTSSMEEHPGQDSDSDDESKGG